MQQFIFVLSVFLLSNFAAKGQRTFYINDNATTNDVFTTSVGNNTTGTINDASKPFATLSFIFSNYDLTSGDVIRVDAGTYSGKVTFGSNDDGFTLEGADTTKTIFTDGVDGRIFSIENAANDNITIKKIRFQDVYNNAVTISSAGGGGGAIYTDVSVGCTGLILDQCVITAIDMDAGGAIYISPSSSFTITNSSFYANSCSVSTNQLYENGAAIYVDASATSSGGLSLTNCYFRSNSAQQRGGAVFIKESTGTPGSYTITSCTFRANSTGSGDTNSQGGGAFFGGEDHTYTFNSCTFTGNFTNASYGSSNYFGGGAININCDDTPTSVTLTSCTFTGNYITNANAGGGALNFVCHHSGSPIPSTPINSTLAIFGCTFTGNYSQHEDGDGGAISIYKTATYPYHLPSATIQSTAFNSNYCTNSSINTDDGLGGAISMGIGSLTISNSSFTSNYAGVGGALALNAETVSIANTSFVQNSAVLQSPTETLLLGGGAIYYSPTRGNSAHSITLTQLTFDGNTTQSQHGGAICYKATQYYNGTLNCTKSTFKNNRADLGNNTNVHGGAIHIEQPSSIVPTWSVLFQNSLFHDNQCSGNGGAASFRMNASSTANLQFDFCTVTQNSSTTAANTHGIYVFNQPTNFSLTNSICYANTNGISGYDVNSLATGTETVTYSCYQRLNSLSAGTGSTTSDPLFYSTSTNDFHLSNLSPLENAANPSATLADDIESVLRPDGGGRDIGAFEGVASSTNSALPIELLYFTGNRVDRKVLISWATASENNNAYFQLERSTNGIDYETIASIQGQIASQCLTNYDYSDYDLLVEDRYYRLIQQDINGIKEVKAHVYIPFEDKYRILQETYNLLGQPVPFDTPGIKINVYTDHTTQQVISY